MSNSLAEIAKRQALEKLKKKGTDMLKKQALQLLTNPYVLGALALGIAIFLFFFIIASAVSSANAVISSNVISDKILPPQIYASDMEDLITSDYGKRVHPVTGEVSSFHSGIDIGVPEGTPVASSFEGVVTTVSFPTNSDAESTQNAGIYVVVQSSDPEIAMSSRYLHLSQAFVTTGQVVRKGEIIGLSGNTGRSTGAHLHYELIPDGEEATDPKPYVMLISKLTDVASEEAFKAFKKVKWDTPVTSYLTGDHPKYLSKKMLYLSNINFEGSSIAPFNENGVGYTRPLLRGGWGPSSNFYSNGNVPTVPDPSEEEEKEEVYIPPNLGSLTDPFFIQYAVMAQYEERRSGVPASITLAQAALESGRGKNAVCNYNMFGIKANKSYKGDYCLARTHEEVDGVRVPTTSKFRSYSSVAGSFADHSDFLLKNSRYRFALSKENPYEFANELQRAGYATDSQYANKLKSIIRKQNLASLDMNQGIDPTTGQPFTDIGFVGGGGGDGGDGGAGSLITVTFGISQYYGGPAFETHEEQYMNGKYHTVYKAINDPTTGNPIINFENYDRVVHSSQAQAPVIEIKDIPEAIRVTIYAPNEREFYVMNVDYIKGTY
ncbi:glucosaminidase domain-containing protein [Paenibacillus sp. FSL K6-2859]|uniref:glucosaminidase domain-containing protein n=1 Tax=Paenibacillus sp. FSL K6-2859 TaxID=2921482 RepID=UPI0030F82E7D